MLFETWASGKVFFNDTANGAGFCTSAAINTLIVINYCKIVLNLNSSVLTSFCALATTDTAVGASLSSNRTLVVIGAENCNTGTFLNKLNDLVRAGSGTHTATNTKFRINAGNTVFNIYRILRTNGNAVSVSETSECAVFVTVIAHIGYVAALFAAIVELSVRYVAITVAGNVCDLNHNCIVFKSHDLCDLRSGSVTTGYAGVSHVAFTRRKRLCISVTTTVTASATVGTW